ncbi:phage antirepressor KilAC domain-containing protein [uncultured Cohaesibacter sp.]|uniref:phage antirepressor KilAC domain-containing protein n=1 Tax=uncultured Cohaesibacter sp. TaxID=1002546 RepID=UPI0029C8148E|nr:phage antirepressor KilAC domain-containing protein [uncultured Cohaesibacter sp.]
MNGLTNISPEMTMSSQQIAEVVNSRHDKVKQSIERLAERGTIQLPPLGEVRNHLGQAVKVYNVNERDSYIVVAQLSPEFTAKLVDFWQAHRNKPVALPNFEDPIAAAEAWIEAKKEGRKAVLALEAAAPKIESYQHFIAARSENYNLNRAMKTIGAKPNLATRALRKRGVLFGTPATPAQYYRDKGYFTMLPVEDRNNPGKMRPQTFVTPKGLEWLRRRLPEIMGPAQ